MDRISRIRHELIDGQILAMSSASKRHDDIASATLANLYQRLRGRGCSVNGSDLR
ncbi:Uma2 family endonuclease [Aggregatilineales bacterium SYSU G02658]